MISLNNESYYKVESPSYKQQKCQFCNNLKILHNLKQDKKKSIPESSGYHGKVILVSDYTIP